MLEDQCEQKAGALAAEQKGTHARAEKDVETKLEMGDGFAQQRIVAKELRSDGGSRE
jgi:hypothetical protein